MAENEHPDIPTGHASDELIDIIRNGKTRKLMVFVNSLPDSSMDLYFNFKSEDFDRIWIG